MILPVMAGTIALDFLYLCEFLLLSFFLFVATEWTVSVLLGDRADAGYFARKARTAAFAITLLPAVAILSPVLLALLCVRASRLAAGAVRKTLSFDNR